MRTCKNTKQTKSKEVEVEDPHYNKHLLKYWAPQEVFFFRSPFSYVCILMGLPSGNHCTYRNINLGRGRQIYYITPPGGAPKLPWALPAHNIPPRYWDWLITFKFPISKSINIPWAAFPKMQGLFSQLASHQKSWAFLLSLYPEVLFRFHRMTM